MEVLTNQVAILFELFLKQNNDNNRNGTVGINGNMTPIVPSDKETNPKSEYSNFLILSPPT